MSTILRPRKQRTKSGCLCCRMRRKKCDEQKPTCKKCEIMGLACCWLKTPEFSWRKKLQQGSHVAYVSVDEEHDNKFMRLSLGRRIVSSPLLTGLPHPLLPCSKQRILNYYIRESCRHLTGKSSWPQFKNPFIWDVIPVAHADEMVMDAILAIGAVHLAHTSGDREIKQEALSHYVRVLDKTKLRIGHCCVSYEKDAERMLLITVLLCIYESFSGNRDDVICQHLRASRQFALCVGARQATQHTNQTLIGFLLENYAYFELMASVRLTGREADLQAILPSFIRRLDSLNYSSAFGALLGYGSRLYELIPMISLLIRDRQSEMTQGRNLSCVERYIDMWAQLLGWSTQDNVTELSEIHEFDSRIAAAMLLRNVLLIWLMAAFNGDIMTANYLLTRDADLMNESVSLIREISKTDMCMVTFWPSVVVGTFAQTPEHRETIENCFSGSTVPCVARGKEMLHWVWDDPDVKVVGILGLERLAKARGTGVCIA